ncbi:MAG TPA: TIGR03936 family radical SAM-associated protein, partial [Thermodesulfovibrionales bacterium]|nr:TIGR03936 family radical SAM-associated protein [Thermodesulfovibrionales bacterium]
KAHDVEMSLLEAAFSRGDKTLALLIEKAWSLGCRLDGWSEIFNFGNWEKAMDFTGIDASDYARKTYGVSDRLPWENIDIGVTQEFLWKEKKKALEEYFTPDCSKICLNCGLQCHDAETERNGEAGKMKKSGYVDLSPCLRNTVSSIHDPMVGARRFKPVRIRVEFSKAGRLRYLSHLELMATLYRAIRRAEFPLVYSEGYHPSPKISFGPPLGVGVSGLSEYFDMEVIPPFDIVWNRRKLNRTLPKGISVKDMAVIPSKEESLSSFITRYGYEIKGRDLSHINKFLAEKEINMHRERNVINLRSMVEEARQVGEDTVYLIAVDQGDVKVRLGELLPRVFNIPLEDLEITRIVLYGWNSGWVKPLERSSQWTAKS